jgi:hypothetical protein
MFRVAGPEACGRNIAAISMRASILFHAYGIVSFEVQILLRSLLWKEKAFSI